MLWFAKSSQYIFSTFNILTVYIYNIYSGSDNDNLTVVQYDFPYNNIEEVNSIAKNKFPKNFYFGITRNAYQIKEGWNDTGKGQSVWDYMTHVHPLIINNRSNADIATDSYYEYQKDIQLAKNLGYNMYGISLSWLRILPDGYGKRMNEDGIRYYNDLINEILANGMQPMVTIFHWDLPYTLRQLGGWLNPLMSDFFENYAKIVFTAFGDRVKYWITINEPINICTFGYAYESALNQTGIADYLCGHNLLLAHAQIYNMYNREFRHQKGKVGISLPLTWFEHNNGSLEDITATERAYQWFNGWFLHPLLSETGDYPEIMKNQIIFHSFCQGFTRSRLPAFTNTQVLDLKKSLDFLEISYYTAHTIRSNIPDIRNISFWNDAKIEEVFENDLPEEPPFKNTLQGLEKLLNRLNNDYVLPEIIIRENDYDGTRGIVNVDEMIQHHQHISKILSTMQRGINIRGYIYGLVSNR